MALHLFTNFCLLSVIITFLAHIPTSVSAIYEQYQNCSTPFTCANRQNIGYPFWGLSRSEYCGYPGYELECGGDVPEITIMGVTYRVLGINSTSETFTVAREDYWDDNCPSNPVSDTLNSSLFVPLHSEETDSNNYFFIWGSNTVNSSLSTPIKNYFGSCSTNVTTFLEHSTVESMLSNPNSVNLSTALRDGVELRWYANNSLCNECKRSGGLCGYETNTGEFTCYCPDEPYSSTCPRKGNLYLSRKIAIGVTTTIAWTVILCFVVILKRKKGRFSCNPLVPARNDQDVEAVMRNYGSLAPKRYKYSDVKRMTNSFRDKVGQGGFGVVYRGKLYDGSPVAVKVLSKSEGKGEEFMNEVACISRTSHVNIVALLGFCYDGTKRALIFEFMSNGSLDKFIYNQGSFHTDHHLEWKVLNQIMVGVARGLEYLHRGCNTRIVHFDIKPHNILLDEDFCPKISDFGLAKLCKKKESIISMLEARGTIGYIAPEVFCRNFGRVSHKSDVYGFGMMVLEIVGVRKNIVSVSHKSSELYFPDWIYNLLELGEDLTLLGIASNEEEEIARKMILVSLWCVQTNPSDRPSMSEVIEMLGGGLESLQVPPKPSLYSSPTPRISFPNSSSISTSLSLQQE